MLKLRTNKRGTHVGMIVSFLIFVTFLAFLYSVLEPATQVKQDKLDLQEYIKVELLKEFTAEMSILNLEVNNINVCFSLNIQGLEDTGVVVKDSQEHIIISSFNWQDDETYLVDEGDGRLKAYYSNEFSNGNGNIIFDDCIKISTPEDYNISIFRTEEDFFNSSIIELTEYINANPNNYEEIKTKLKISSGDEFGFAFKDENKTLIIATQEKNVSANVYVEEIPIQYIDSEANINQGFLDIRVW